MEKGIAMHRRITKFACLALVGTGLCAAASGAAVPIEAKLKQIMLERAYERSVMKGAPQKPWSSADMKVIGKLRHPRLGESAVILSAGTVEAMRAGPTLLPGSAAIGAPGTSVISAHRDTHFAFLQYVRKGDVIEAAGSDGSVMRYRVTAMEIVEADEFSIPVARADNALVLSTCYPFGDIRGGTLRYVVHAEQM